MNLKVERLSKSYVDGARHLPVIENLSYQFPESGTVAIVGKSGVGKSTLLQLMAGLDTPSSGSVTIDGAQISTLSVERRSALRNKKIGIVFQFHHLLGEFSAVENVALPLLIAGVAFEQAAVRARTLLERVGMKERFAHRPGQLSGGEQQRVAIARALIAGPSLILADEPTGSLDQQTAREVQSVLLEIAKEQGALLVLVTHNLELASSMDRQLELRPGGILASEAS